MRIDNESYPKVISGLKLNIGWNRWRVFSGTDVLHCFKCRDYNHKSSECKNDDTCYKCKNKGCNKEIVKKCINCVKENKRLNLGLEEDHATFNIDCPVYQNRRMLRKRRIGLAIQQPRKIHGIYTKMQGLLNNFTKLEIIAEKEIIARFYNALRNAHNGEN